MKILLLAGTSEARQLAEVLASQPGFDVTASLSGATRSPRDLPVATRVGGFGGREGQIEYLRKNEIEVLVDATHPFANRISQRSWEICADLGLPFLQILRRPWQAASGDRWTMVENGDQAADHIADGSRVFLATGRQTLSEFAGLAKCYLICRQIDPPEQVFPFPNGEYLIGRPPFSVQDEYRLFQDLKVDWLVVKNAGGAASRTKLDAARRLAMPVLMLDRPPPPDGPRVQTAQQALVWIKDQQKRVARYG